MHYYFIGIGGIGMSALARMLVNEGYRVSGSDRDQSKITETLRAEGIDVSYSQAADNISNEIDAVVYTVAVSADHPELAEARRRGIATFSYPELLGYVSRDKYTIAIAGTHGKTTTTAMAAMVLTAAGFDPTVIVGSLMQSADGDGWASNVRVGSSQYFVVEADEYRRSFHELSPDLLLITNLEADHLDYYRDLADIQQAFRDVVLHTDRAGAVIADAGDAALEPVLSGVERRVIDTAQLPADELALAVPGAHNRENARRVLALADHLGIPRGTAISALNSFRGTWRRFEYKGEAGSGALVYDDYAHHPTEIRSTLAGLREKYPTRRLWVVFQPHLWSRTAQLADAFSESFADADEVIVAPVYAAREAPPASAVTHTQLAEKIRSHHARVRALDTFDSIVDTLTQEAEAGDVVVTMGAGDIYTIGARLGTASPPGGTRS